MQYEIPRSSVGLAAAGAALALLLTSAIAEGVTGVEDVEERMSAARIADGLNFPTAMDVTETGDILVAEKFGTVRMIRDGEVLSEPLATFEVYGGNEGGLVGMTALPEWSETGEFLVAYTPGGEEPEAIHIAKLAVDDGTGEVVDDPFIEIPSRVTDRHFGGHMDVGPDGYLYYGAGEQNERTHAQNPDTLPGSVLRFNLDGTVPEDNPFGEDNAVWATGFRNPYGLTVTGDGRVFVVDNGENFNGEINVVEAGQNYGWPLVEGYCDGFPRHEPCGEIEAFTPPRFEFRMPTGPTGIAVYDRDEPFESLEGRVFAGGWHSERIHHFEMLDDGRLQQGHPLFRLGNLHAHVHEGDGHDHAGSFTDVEVGPSGDIFVLEAGPESGAVWQLAEGEIEHNSPVDPDDEEGGGSSGQGCSTTTGSGTPFGALTAALAILGLRRIRRSPTGEGGGTSRIGL